MEAEQDGIMARLGNIDVQAHRTVTPSNLAKSKTEKIDLFDDTQLAEDRSFKGAPS
jgi:hypothetical protein